VSGHARPIGSLVAVGATRYVGRMGTLTPLVALVLQLGCNAPPTEPDVESEAEARPGGPSSSTNLLLIVIDTLRADRLGAHGYALPTTPHLDALAERSLRFARCYSTSSWTRPGFATLLTGLFPRSAGLYEEKYDALTPEVTTLAEVLQATGRRTLAVSSNPNIDPAFGFDQGFDVFVESGRRWDWQQGIDHVPEVDYTVSTLGLPDAGVVTDRVLAVLDAESGDMPWAMMAVYLDPHTPYEPPPAHRAAVEGSTTPGYDGEVRYADAEVGRLLAALGERGLLDDTLVVVTSDHGEGLDSHPGQPRSVFHGDTVYDSVTHVPWLLHHPGLPAGVFDPVVSSVDVLPTVLDLLGAQAPADLPGRSLGSLARGGPPPADLPEHAFSESDWQAADKVTVRTAAWRLVANRDVELFAETGAHEGRTATPGQLAQLEGPVEELYAEGAPELWTENAVNAEPEQAHSLRTALAAWEAATPARPPLNRDPDDGVLFPDGSYHVTAPSEAGTSPTLDPDVRAQLEALGYLQ